jgi:hypothetical protein
MSSIFFSFLCEAACGHSENHCTLLPRFCETLRKEKEVPKVFVVSESPKHNIAPALDYGEIEVVLPPSQSQIIFSSAPTVSRIKRVLEVFTDDDYLLFIGDPTAIAILATVAAAKNNGRFKCLKWDKQERRYLPIQIDIFPHRGSDDD